MPKIIGRSLTEHRSEVRTRVFDALRDQLYERGFDAITLAGVATAAGVGRSSIYNHFPDRSSLLVAFVEHEAARYVDELTVALAAAPTPVEKLAVYVRLQLRRLAEFHMPPGRTLSSTLDPAAYRRIAAHADPLERVLTEIVESGIAAGQMADEDPTLLVAMIGAALSARQVADSAEAAVRVILRSVGAK